MDILSLRVSQGDYMNPQHVQEAPLQYKMGEMASIIR